MFGSNRDITGGTNQELSMVLTIFLWSGVRVLKHEFRGNMDYLQLFELKETITNRKVLASFRVFRIVFFRESSKMTAKSTLSRRKTTTKGK